MNSIIVREHLDFNPDVIKGANPPLVNRSTLKSPSTLRNITLSSQLNHSQGLEDKTITNLYSAALLTLVQECLFREPESRPTANVLVEHTNFGLQTAMVKLKKTRPFPLLPHPFRNMKFNDTDGPVEPPTAWLVNHVQDENGGGYYDARDEPPPKRSMLSTALDVVSPIVTRSVRSSLSSGSSIFSSLVGSTITRATTPNQSSSSGGASRPVSRPTSPPTPGLGIARKMAGGMMAFAGIGARFVFNTAMNQVSGRKVSLTSVMSAEEAQVDGEFEIIDAESPRP